MEIIFNEDFEFIIKNKNGGLLEFDMLSNAEQLCLAISFIATINKIIGVELPFVIDFLSVLDNDAKIRMAKVLLELSRENQIILLYTAIEDEFIDILSEASKIYGIYYYKSGDSKVILDD